MDTACSGNGQRQNATRNYEIQGSAESSASCDTGRPLTATLCSHNQSYISHIFTHLTLTMGVRNQSRPCESQEDPPRKATRHNPQKVTAGTNSLNFTVMFSN